MAVVTKVVLFWTIEKKEAGQWTTKLMSDGCNWAMDSSDKPRSRIQDALRTDRRLQHNRGLPYLGNFDTEAGCQHACEALSNCTQYDWCGVTGGSVWNGKCFGRCDSVWRLSFVPGLSPAGTEGGNAGVGWPVSARRVEPDKR